MTPENKQKPLSKEGYWVDGFVFKSKDEYIRCYLEKDVRYAIRRILDRINREVPFLNIIPDRNNKDNAYWNKKLMTQIKKIIKEEVGELGDDDGGKK